MVSALPFGAAWRRVGLLQGGVGAHLSTCPWPACPAGLRHGPAAVLATVLHGRRGVHACAQRNGRQALVGVRQWRHECACRRTGAVAGSVPRLPPSCIACRHMNASLFVSCPAGYQQSYEATIHERPAGAKYSLASQEVRCREADAGGHGAHPGMGRARPQGCASAARLARHAACCPALQLSMTFATGNTDLSGETIGPLCGKVGALAAGCLHGPPRGARARLSGPRRAHGA